MELVERAGFLASLQAAFKRIAAGEGHCMLINGEAGIGKTSLVRSFCASKKNSCKILQGSCDAMFTPRPLAPLYDIAVQMNSGMLNDWDVADRTVLFSRLFQELSDEAGPLIVVFEDIHWADEATLDFIKFLARRISLTKCMFILTYRDNEIHARHPLRNVLGQLQPDSFTRLQLPPLSREAVDAMAEEKGYRGEDVYSISGGIPFYVNEILASYSPGVPDNIKDSVLSVYHRHEENTRRIWTILSVLPTGINSSYLEKMEPSYEMAIEDCMNSGILLAERGNIFFKHELYRRTIEASLSPLTRVALNKKILNMFLEDFERNGEIERIVHHAKNANEYEIVVEYAPQAAKVAASAGAHIEAAKLYFTAIEYYQENDQDKLLELYTAYAYECYLTNQTKEAIIYQGKALSIRKEKADPDKTGDCLRFLSRLWWFDGNRKQAEYYGTQAMEVLREQPDSRAKAMAFSNMSQLKMLSNESEESIFWGEKAIGIARKLDDEEVLCHALNNIGSVKTLIPQSQREGVALLQQSLEIALKNSYHEHAARAYTNLGDYSQNIHEFDIAEKVLLEGIAYCRKMELGSWTAYMSSSLARLYLYRGRYDDAVAIAEQLADDELQSPLVKIKSSHVLASVRMRKGDANLLPLLIEAKYTAFDTGEPQRILPVAIALLEFEWLSNDRVMENSEIDRAIDILGKKGSIYERAEFAFWLSKVRKRSIFADELLKGYQVNTVKAALESARYWEGKGCPYEQALMLFEGDEDNKKEAILIMQNLGASVVYEKLKLEMRASGIKSIPRGMRESTRANAARLTDRELDVLQLLKHGLKNKEIADKLFISAKTVDHHISSILVKLDVNSRAKAVNEAARLGIVK